MLEITNFEIVGWEHAIRGMRNPMNSWAKSDSVFCSEQDGCDNCPHFTDIECPGHAHMLGTSLVPGEVGPEDHRLMMSLANGGPVHAKYRRMITVYLDINAPLYWWKEFDTYKVGTVANSCSTMHKIHAKEFEVSDFSMEHLMSYDEGIEDEFLVYTSGDRFSPATTMYLIIDMLNHARQKYLLAKNKPMKDESKRAGLMKKYRWQMIQLLPTSYNQKRTVMLSYEVLHNIYHSRRHHKLDEWHAFCDWIEKLPYSEIITAE